MLISPLKGKRQPSDLLPLVVLVVLGKISCFSLEGLEMVPHSGQSFRQSEMVFEIVPSFWETEVPLADLWWSGEEDVLVVFVLVLYFSLTTSCSFWSTLDSASEPGSSSGVVAEPGNLSLSIPFPLASHSWSALSSSSGVS